MLSERMWRRNPPAVRPFLGANSQNVQKEGPVFAIAPELPNAAAWLERPRRPMLGFTAFS
jgi:hypothetical protein